MSSKPKPKAVVILSWFTGEQIAVCVGHIPPQICSRDIHPRMEWDMYNRQCLYVYVAFSRNAMLTIKVRGKQTTDHQIWGVGLNLENGHPYNPT